MDFSPTSQNNFPTCQNAGVKIILAGGKIILVGWKIILTGLVTTRQSHPVRAREFPEWSSPDDPARVLTAVGRLNPSFPKSLIS